MHPHPVVHEPVAIVGIGCRFPGALGPRAFWQLLHEGVDAVTEVPPDRWDGEALYDPDPAAPGKMTTRWGGFLRDVDRFDAAFFGLSPRETYHVDPQQRLMLEVAWEALEDAGLPPHDLAGSPTGVFLSVISTDYATDLFTVYSDRVDAYSGTGTTRSLIAARIAYFLDLRGPNLTVDTACSGGLTAINLAVDSLRRGDSSVALAGGVNLILRPDGNLFFSKAGALAPDGRCKPFDARANGIVRSDGAGVLVLKPLSRAVADGDRIYALVLGGAINQDGRSAGVMAPNPEAQIDLLGRAHRDAGVSPADIQYIEAHGTGTIVGDPIEARSLGQVLKAGRPEGSVCVLGSVKSNLGHTESAAGIAGVIKVALSMLHRTLPGTVHFRTPNPMVPFAELGLEVRGQAGPWPSPDRPLLAGVSSFGIGGTNAHVVLGEAPPPAAEERPRDPRLQVLALSARHPDSLTKLAAAYRDLLGSAAAPPFDEVCQAAAVSRSHLEQRLAVVAATADDAAGALEAFASGEPHPRALAGRAPVDREPRLVFVLSGQGTHWPGMGRTMLATEPVFARTVRRCDEVVRELAGWSLLDALAADEPQALAATASAQPAIFAVQAALIDLWASWGIEPDAVIGQSLGEAAAAYAAGALSLEDALAVVHHRSRLMQRVAGRGATALVALTAEQARLVLTGYGGKLVVAGNSSPTSTVVSGDPESIERLLAALAPENIFARALQGVDVAFHGPQMDPLVEELAAALAGLRPRPARVPILSTVTAGPIAGEELGGEYWGRNLRQPFRFAEALAALAADGYDSFLEVGPHAVLGGPVRQVLQAAGAEALVLASMRRDEADGATLYAALGELYVHGHPVDWRGVHPRPVPHVALPTYPWRGQRFWLDQLREGGGAAAAGAGSQRGTAGHPLLGEHRESAYPAGQHLWERDLTLRSLHWLDEHRIHGAAVLPGVAHLEMARRAVEELAGPLPVELEKVVFESPLVLPEDGSAVRLQFVLDGDVTDGARFQLFSRPAADESGPWTRHSSGRVFARTAVDATPAVDLEAARRRCADAVPEADFYAELEEDHGFVYGPTFRAVRQLRWRPGEATARVELPVSSGVGRHFWYHPGLLDSTLQTVAQALKGSPTLLPSEIGRMVFRKPAAGAVWVQAVITDDGPAADGSRLADVFTCDEDGTVVAEVRGLLVRRLGRDRGAGSLLHRLRWTPSERQAPAAAAPGWWLVLADRGGVAGALESLLADRGEPCVCVERGDGFAREGRRIVVDPAAPEDFKRLLREAGEGGRCRGVVGLWGLDVPGGDELAAGSLDAALAAGTTPLLWLVQALGEAGWERIAEGGAPADAGEVPRLWWVTRGAQAVDPAESVAVAQAPAWGLGRVVLREHPELWGGLVDLDPEATVAAAAAELLAEIGEPSPEPGVAFRLGRRHALRLEAGGAAGGALPVLRPDAAYLVTGGLGDLGLVAARWLAEHGARHLLLAGRSGLPPRREWSAAEPGGAVARAVAAVRELEALGVGVQPVALDVADAAALDLFLEDQEREGRPPIRGVVHAAGVLSDQMLARMTPRDLEAAWRPKIHGAWNLDRALRRRPLDLFVLYSSVASVLGTFGQGNYAAGNAFLDALAQERRAAGLAGLSLNWGPWAQIGMAARIDPLSMQAQGGIQMLTPAEGSESLGRSLAGREAQLLVARVDWAAWAESMGSEPARRLVEHLVEQEAGAAETAAAPPTAFAEEVRALTDPAARRAKVQQRLLELCSMVTRIDAAQLDIRLPLPSLGFDSILTAEIRGQIRTQFGVEIPLAGMLLGANLARVSELVLAALDPMPAGSDAVPATAGAAVEAGRPEATLYVN